jgi:tetratricopeptide (TPR) repeat protein
MIRKIVILFALLCIGCSSNKAFLKKEKTKYNKSALEHLIEASILDLKQEYPAAILEYQEALQYDSSAVAIYYALAKDYMILGKYESAKRILRKALQFEPSNLRIREQLANVYLTLGEFGLAEQELLYIIKGDPDNLYAHYILAELYLKSGRQDRLIEQYKTILKFDYNSTIVKQLADYYQKKEKYKEAKELLEEAYKSFSDDYEIVFELGKIYEDESDTLKAVNKYKESLELYPLNDGAWNRLSRIYIEGKKKKLLSEAVSLSKYYLGKDSTNLYARWMLAQTYWYKQVYDSAVVEYEKLKSKLPNEWSIHYWLGLSNYYNKNPKEAEENLRKAAELNPANPDAWSTWARFLIDEGRNEDAYNVLTRALRAIPYNSELLSLIGFTLNRMGRDNEAIEYLRKSLRFSPKDVETLSTLALIYDSQKRYEQSDSTYEVALKIAPDNHLLLNNYGYSLADRGIQLERALKMIQKALEQDPENGAYLDSMGWIYFKLGDYKNAVYYIEKSVKVRSTSAVVLEHLGDVYEKLGDIKKARENWEKALKLDSKNETLRQKLGIK